ncbi:MAG TPA: retropepsin-like aspartic protease [Planctomycetota bacterium]|nr:retropepsin-like aspartic protease [Planctomycetota bacterium]
MRLAPSLVLAPFVLLAPATAQTRAELPDPERVALQGKLPAAIAVKRAKSGHLLVQARVDGEDAGWFIFDTGAGMSCVDRSIVERLELPDAGPVQASGSAGVAAQRLRKVKSLAFGPVLVEGFLMLELDLGPIGAAMGEEIHGIIGYETFFAGVFELDLAQPAITVHDAESFTPPEGHEWQPLTFVGRRPHVTGSIEGREPGLFLLDVGANTALTVHTKTVDAFALLDGRETETAKLGGVGGMHEVPSGTLAHVVLAGQKVEDVKAFFARVKTGALTGNDGVQASVGVDLLKRFRCVFDYRGKKVLLLPRE